MSTGHNNYAMSTAVDSVAKTYINGNTGVREGLLNRIEAAVRAYDPCLSCSTHALGQMPIIVDLVDPAGNTVQTIRRDGAVRRGAWSVERGAWSVNERRARHSKPARAATPVLVAFQLAFPFAFHLSVSS